MSTLDDTIYSVGFDKNFNRGGALVTTQTSDSLPAPSLLNTSGGGLSSSSSSSTTITNPITGSTPASQILAGDLSQILFSGKTSFTDTSPGFKMGVDKDGIYKWTIGGVTSSIDWSVTTLDTLTIRGAGLVSPVIRFGKTSFTDSANAGYYISSEGIYVGSIGDVSKLKYAIATGVFDFIGTVSSRSTLTIASAINASGNLVTDIINGRLDSSAKTILSDFNFGAVDYAGAVKAGTITWNTTTGAITGGSGVVVYRGGIVGANTGVATFTLDAATGNATFAGTLSAPTGTLGALTVNGSLNVSTAGNIKSGQTAYDTGAGWFMEYNGGTPRLSIGDGTTTNSLTWDGTTLNVNGSTITNSSIFGDGSDGDVTISADTTLTTDMYYNNLTIQTGKTLNPGGYRIFVKGTLTFEGTGKIARNGNNGGNASGFGLGATVGTAGAGLASGSIYGSLAGKNGSLGGESGSVNGTNGLAGNDADKSIGLVGVAGGAGGSGTSGFATPGTAGAGGAITGTIYNTIKNAIHACLMVDFNPSLLFLKPSPSGGSGGGGSAGRDFGSPPVVSAGAGGGSGSSGGIVVVFARKVVTVNGNVYLQADGGNGGNGSAGNTVTSPNVSGGGGGGGAGGNGGVVVLVYSSKSGTGTISVAGGTKGTGGASTYGSAGSNGTDGQTGKTVTLIV